jgi:hypothetical protein
MDTIANLLRDLGPFEEGQFNIVKDLFPSFAFNSRDMCDGTAQFVVVQGPDVSNASNKESNLSVICAVGINYSQTDRTEPCPTSLEHYLNRADSVCDHDLHRDMRDPLDLSLAAYNRNTTAWVAPEQNRGLPSKCKAYASDSALAGLAFQTSDGVFVLDDYILVISNFSPFLTKDLWGNFSANQSKGLLDAWPPRRHLDPLVELLRDRVDLWVGHSKDSVWKPFWTLREQKKLDPWILTFNLSGLGLVAIKATKNDPNSREHPLYR